jgi:hypothetical protein
LRNQKNDAGHNQHDNDHLEKSLVTFHVLITGKSITSHGTGDSTNGGGAYTQQKCAPGDFYEGCHGEN